MLLKVNYLERIQKNPDTIKILTDLARRLKPTLIERYFIFVQEMLTDSKSVSIDGTMDIAKYIEFQQHYKVSSQWNNSFIDSHSWYLIVFIDILIIGYRKDS